MAKKFRGYFEDFENSHLEIFPKNQRSQKISGSNYEILFQKKNPIIGENIAKSPQKYFEKLHFCPNRNP